MKERLSNRLGFIGAGAGLALFAIFGLMPGAFLGGMLGLNMANNVFGMPALPTLMPRMFVVVGMLTGVMVTGLIFVISGASLGWLIGLAVDSMSRRAKEPAAQKINK